MKKINKEYKWMYLILFIADVLLCLIYYSSPLERYDKLSIFTFLLILFNLYGFRLTDSYISKKNWKEDSVVHASVKHPWIYTCVIIEASVIILSFEFLYKYILR